MLIKWVWVIILSVRITFVTCVLEAYEVCVVEVVFVSLYKRTLLVFFRLFFAFLKMNRISTKSLSSEWLLRIVWWTRLIWKFSCLFWWKLTFTRWTFWVWTDRNFFWIVKRWAPNIKLLNDWLFWNLSIWSFLWLL